MKPRHAAARSEQPPSIAEIEAALFALAEIIEAHGDASLPLFLYLESELDAARKKSETLARVKAIAGSKSAAQTAQQSA